MEFAHIDSDKTYDFDDLIALPDGRWGRVIGWEKRPSGGWRITLELELA
jgi:hypothetical protein